jgi:hypothetical protein
MSTATLDVRDAGLLDVEDDAITFESDVDTLPSSGDMICQNGTYTYLYTHILCSHNS